MSITFTKPELQSNEAFKTFEDVDSLGTSYLDLHGKVSGGSIDILPEEMRKDPAITPFKTIPDLVRSYVETKKMVGGIEKAPEKPDGYKFSAPNNVHAKLKPDIIQAQIRNIAHKAGLGNKAADVMQQEILGLLSSNLVRQDEDRKVQMQTNETALRQEWGGDYDAKFDKIVKTMQLIGGKEMANETEAISSALKGSPGFLKGMGKLVGLLSEDSIKSLGDEGTPSINNADEAKAAITKMETEINQQGLKHPFWDDKHPEHKKIRTLRDELYQKAYPS